MGSIIEFNDTLKLEKGTLPNKLEIGREYTFTINDRRIYHLRPVRVFLVEEIDGLWNFIGHIQITELTINANKDTTSGKFTLTKLYEREYVKLLNKFDTPEGKGYIKE
jgi:hypothetical protein